MPLILLLLYAAALLFVTPHTITLLPLLRHADIDITYVIFADAATITLFSPHY